MNSDHRREGGLFDCIRNYSIKNDRNKAVNACNSSSTMKHHIFSKTRYETCNEILQCIGIIYRLEATYSHSTGV